MRVQELRNYGKGLKDSVPDAEGLRSMQRVSTTMRAGLRRELGEAGVVEVSERARSHVKDFLSGDCSTLRAHGLTDDKFLEGVVRRIAVMKALAELVGMDRAARIQCGLLDETMYDLMMPLFPTIEDYRACGDFFAAFKAYSRASYDANVRAGLHRMDIVQDTPNGHAFNITYCVWHEVAKGFGDPYLCYPSTCYGDEAYVPKALAGSGCVFKRTGTLATGSPVCDFRFEYGGQSES
jgi:hypothetical protein